jgi:hypothetical protein
MYSGINTSDQTTEDERQKPKPSSHIFWRLEVGFPIRKFTDQSLFAAPHDLSQRTTSFIASQHQGIHRIPLRHLIALIIETHPLGRVFLVATRTTRNAEPRSRTVPRAERPIKTSLLQTYPRTLRSSDAHDWCQDIGSPDLPLRENPKTRASRICFLFTM